MTTASWLTILGSSAPDLERTLSSRVAQRIAAGKFTADNVRYIHDAELGLTERSDQKLVLTPEAVESLRSLCQVWEVRLRPRAVSSHRPWIGPIIVFVKRAFYPLFEFFMRDAMHQQRSFNAAAIRAIAQLHDQLARLAPNRN